MLTKEKIWSAIAVLFAVCVTLYTLSWIVLTPWHIVPGLHSDATKNTFTYLYQSTYGHGCWFDGMNYPYGEHIVYTDGVPLLSVFFARIGNVSAETALTVLWWLVGLSYVLCVFFIYKILVRFRVHFPVAVVFAGLITILSPQILRMGGHYALSFLCIVPMLFYWTIRYNDSSQLKYCIYIFCCGAVTAFLHPYFAAMVLIWGLFYILAYFIATRQGLRQKVVHVLPLTAAIMLVFALVVVTMKATDPVKDRPLTPYGMLTYTTYKRDIATSVFSPVWSYIKEHKQQLGRIVPNISEGGEGYSYLGLVVIALIIFSICSGLAQLVARKKDKLVLTRDNFSPVWILIAVFAVVFSMGVPYIWNMEWLFDRFMFLRQFRTLGRFSWMFYYITAVYAVVVLHQWYLRQAGRQRKPLATVVLIAGIFVWTFEASGYTGYIRGIARRATANYETYCSTKDTGWAGFLAAHGYKPSDFQAILGLSFFHIGSDKLWVGEGTGVTPAGIAAYQLHLPIINVMMSRSSLSQTMKQVKIAAGPYATKPLLEDVKSTKPFLVLHFPGDVLSVDEEYLLQFATHTGKFMNCEIYSLDPAKLAAGDQQHRNDAISIARLMTATDTCIGSASPWYADHMDGGHASQHFFGTGGAACIAGGDSVIATIPVQLSGEGEGYELSGWFLLSDKNYGSPVIMMDLLDEQGNKIGEQMLQVKASLDNHGMWFRAGCYFGLSSKCRSVRCRLVNEPAPAYIAMDELLLRPIASLIISKDAKGRVLANNHLVFEGNK